MTRKKNQNIYTLRRIIYIVIVCISTSEFKLIDPIEFDSNNHYMLGTVY